MSGAMTATALGFFGKLPARGDFVRSGLPGSFVRPWDDWLQEALPASRAMLGGCWGESWLVAPFWRLSLPAGVCGPDPVVGVACPSVDSVGREFPLLLAALLPGVAHGPVEDWLTACEHLALDAVQNDVSPDVLADALAQLGLPAAAGPAEGGWWTEGGPYVAPSCRTAILPDGAGLAAMLRDMATLRGMK